jgi:hypothetical protein
LPLPHPLKKESWRQGKSGTANCARGHVTEMLKSDWLLSGHVTKMLQSDWLLSGHMIKMMQSDWLLRVTRLK